MTIRIAVVDRDGDAVALGIDIEGIRLIVMANVRLDGDLLQVYDSHVDGPGANSLGPASLRRLASKVLEISGAQNLELHGFQRTTGASPGRVPRPLRFSRRGGKA